MKKGISVWAFDGKRPLNEVFALAKEAGFDGVELAIAEDGPIMAETSEAECQAIVSQAADAGIELVALASGLGWKYPLTASDPGIRERGLAATAASLKVARQLGLDSILLVPGGVGVDFIKDFPLTPYDVAYANAIDALRTLAPTAEAEQVVIGVENVWNKFLLSPLEMRGFLTEVGSPFVKSYFDVGNVIATGYPEHWVPILGQNIQRVHFKDFKRSVGTLAGFCDLGDGDVDFPAVIDALKAVGYDGWVTAEYFNCEGDLPKISQSMDRILSE